MEALELVILSAEGVVLRENVNRVSMRGIDGSFGVMRNHAPMIAALEKGAVVYYKGDKELACEISGGIAEIKDNRITILTG